MTALKAALAVAARLVTPHAGKRARRRLPLAWFPLADPADPIPFPSEETQ